MAITLNILAYLFFPTLVFSANVQPEKITEPSSWTNTLSSEVEKTDEEFEGNLGVLIEDLNTKERFSYNAGQRYYIASVVKVFIMAEIYRLIEEKKIDWNDTVTVKKSKYRDGAGQVNWIPEGNKITIKKLLDLMMNKSDNAATDILFEITGIPAVDDIARKHGAFDLGTITTMIEIRRIIWRQLHPLAGNLTALDYIDLWNERNFDKKLPLFSRIIGKPDRVFTYDQFLNAFNKFYDEGYNSASLVAMLDFFRNLDEGRIVNPKASKQMIDVLADCQTGTDRIKSGLPKDWKYAHKTGTQFRRICDMGIAYGPAGEKLAILMCATNFSNQKNAEDAMAKITKAIFEPRAKSVLPEPESLKQNLMPTMD